MTFMKVAALVAQLVLSFHGEGHLPHDEHRNDRRVVVGVAR
jgi:hypothetical protein